MNRTLVPFPSIEPLALNSLVCVPLPQGFLRKFDTNRDGVLDFGEFMNGWRMTFGVDADHILLQALRSAPYKKPFSLTTHYAASESAIASKITAMKDPMGSDF